MFAKSDNIFSITEFQKKSCMPAVSLETPVSCPQFPLNNQNNQNKRIKLASFTTEFFKIAITIFALLLTSLIISISYTNDQKNFKNLSPQFTNNISVRNLAVINPVIGEIIASISMTQATGFAISQDNKLAAVASYFGFFYLVDISIPSIPSLLTSIRLQSYSVAISKDNKYAFIGTNGFMMFNISNSSAPIWVSLFPTLGAVYDIVLTSDEKTAFINDYGNSLRIVNISDLRNPKTISTIPRTEKIAGVRLSPDESLLFLGYDEKFEIWNVSDLNSTNLILSKVTESRVEDFQFSVNGKFMFYSSRGLTIFNISVPTSPVLISNLNLGEDFTSLVISEANNKAYIVSFNGLSVIDITDKYKPKVLIAIPANNARGIKVSSDGKYAFMIDATVGFQTIEMKINYKIDNLAFTLAKDKVIANMFSQYLFQQTFKSSVLQSLDGQMVYVGGDYVIPQLINMTNPRNPIAIRDLGLNYASSMMLTADGSTLYITKSGKLAIVDVKDRNNVKVNIYSMDVRKACLSDDETLLFVIDTFSLVRVYELQTSGAPIRISSLPYMSAILPFVMPGSPYLMVTRLLDLLVIDVQDIKNPVLIATLAIRNVNDILFSNDGHTVFIATGSTGVIRGSVIILDISDPKNIEILSTISTNDAYKLAIASDEKTLYLADNLGGLLIIDVTDRKFPFSRGPISTGGISSVILSKDEKYAYVTAGNDPFLQGLKVIDIKIEIPYGIKMSKNKFPLGSSYSYNTEFMKKSENGLYESLESKYKFTQILVYSYSGKAGIPIAEKYSSLPIWVTFDISNGLISIEPTSENQIGSLNFYFTGSTYISRRNFSAISSLKSDEDYLNLENHLLSLGYMDSDGFLTQNFNPSTQLLLSSKYLPDEKKIRDLLSSYLITSNLQIFAISSLDVSTFYSENSRYIYFDTYSQFNIKLSINFKEDSCKFIDQEYPASTVISNDDMQIEITGEKTDVNKTLKQIRINKYGLLCNGFITVNDGLNPTLVKQIIDLSEHFIINKMPYLQYNLFPSNTTIINLGISLVSIPRNLFMDPNSGTFENLIYSVQMTNQSQDESRSTLPSYLKFDALTNILTFNLSISDTQYDPDNNRYSLEFELEITAENLAGNKGSYLFTVQAYNYNPKLQYSLFTNDRVQINVEPWTMTIPNNLFLDSNIPSILTYSVYILNESGNSQALPNYLSFDYKANIFSSNPSLDDVDFDSILQLYSKNLSLSIIATNAAGNKASYCFKLLIINYAPQLQYSLFQHNEIQIDVAPWSKTVPANLFSDPNNLNNPSLKYSTKLIAQSGEIRELPDFIFFDDQKNLLSAVPTIKHMDIDPISKTYSKILYLMIEAINNAGNRACYNFTLKIINYSPGLLYQLFPNNKVHINIESWTLAIPSNLFVDYNNPTSPNLHYEIYVIGANNDKENLPSYMTFDDKRNFLSVEPALDKMDYDKKNRKYSRKLNLIIIASNQAKNSISYQFELEISNTAPRNFILIANQVQDITIISGSRFIITLDKDTFLDDDKDFLTYTLFSTGESDSIPNWITFKGLELSGTPPDALPHYVNLKLVANDKFQSAEQQFRIRVYPSAGYIISLIATYIGPLVGLAGLYMNIIKVYNIVGKKYFIHPEMFRLSLDLIKKRTKMPFAVFMGYYLVEANLIWKQILSALFLEEKKQKKLGMKNKILKRVSADFVAEYFRIPENRGIDMEKITDSIKKACQFLFANPKSAELMRNYKTKIEEIKYIITDRIVNFQINSKIERGTLEKFNEVKSKWMNLVKITQEVKYPLSNLDVLNQFHIDKEEFYKLIPKKTHMNDLELKNNPSAKNSFIDKPLRFLPENQIITAGTENLKIEKEISLANTNEIDIQQLNSNDMVKGSSEQDEQILSLNHIFDYSVPEPNTVIIEIEKKNDITIEAHLEVDEINHKLLEQALISLAQKYYKIDTKAVNIDIMSFEKNNIPNEKMTKVDKLKNFARSDLNPIVYNDKTKIVYGLSYTVAKEMLYFENHVEAWLGDKIIVVQVVNKENKQVLREFWFTEDPENN